MQSRRWSLIETVVSTAIGFVFSWCIQLLLNWVYDVHMSHATSVWFTFWFTIASIVRGYWVRRLFNWMHHKHLRD